MKAAQEHLIHFYLSQKLSIIIEVNTKIEQNMKHHEDEDKQRKLKIEREKKQIKVK